MKAIITFHSIDTRNTVLSYPPSLFERLVAGLIEKNIKICSLDELMKGDTDNAVALTFDDGMKSVYENALPVLRDANIPSHLYLTTGYVSKTNAWPTQPQNAPVMDMMGWAELECCVDAGMYIENHTSSHPDLRTLSEEEITSECENADALIEHTFGKRPDHFAFPYGRYEKETLAVVAKRYKTCVTTKLKMLNSGCSPSELPRIDSYYIQHAYLCNHLYSPASQVYLWLRGVMRALKGSY